MVNKGSSNVKDALRVARVTLNRINDRELEDSAIFFWEWWARKANRPTLKMFRMLKAKHA